MASNGVEQDREKTMPKVLKEAGVRREVRNVVAGIKADRKSGYYNAETKRDTLIERLHEDADNLFGRLVMDKLTSDYTVDDLVETALPCATIIKVAEEDAWVEDDEGLWEGAKFGVLASIAYCSLEHLLYQALNNANIDTNDEHPFETKDGGE